MYASFKMSLQDIKSEISNEYYKKGLEIFNVDKKIAKDSLEEFLSTDGELQASEIEKNSSRVLKQMCFYLILIKMKKV
ncbi:hypothetical protein [Sharpea azabuensis]|uniref:hypothetical protein n=1 Tax=Sharpea azabuensis TaxID=322505 RepID=UPI0013DB03CB|nr:hypothetical protein [Sharpea azabuensis]